MTQPAPRPGLEAVTLRRARADDAQAYADMMNDPQVFPGTLQLPYTDASFWRERLLASAAGGSAQAEINLVAETRGQLIAGAGLHPVGTALRRRHAMMLGITVTAGWQGRGVGGLLMSALCEHADRWLGVLRIELTVFADNAAAIALYKKHGFVQEGLFRAHALRAGAYVDTLAMARLHPNPPGWGTAEDLHHRG